MSTGAGCLAEMVMIRKGQILTLAILSIGLVCWSGTTATDTPTSEVESNASSERRFAQPRTLDELLALSADDLDKVDFARMNLLCAEGLRGSENLDVEECIRILDAWTRHVERETKRNFHHFARRPKEFNNSLPYYQMGMLGTVLAEDMRVQYNPERERQLREKPVNLQSVEDEKAFFSSSTDVFIHGLLIGKHVGTCASMPFLYAAVGRRLGYPVTMAARKYHLYVRYEAGNGEHLNMEATENRGFSTPTDEEYRNGPYPMTQEEIDGCGWLRPLSNGEILGICLVNRANCLRSSKRHEEEIQTLGQAARYLPDSAFMRRVIEKNQQLARNLQAADRWDELWEEVATLPLPAAGPMFEQFQNQRLAVQLFMNQSTNLVEIGQAVAGLKDGLRKYRNEISDNPAKIAEAFSPQQRSVFQRQFLALMQSEAVGRRIRIPEAKVPVEYWKGLPPKLEVRVQKLANEREIIEELNVFAAEELNLLNLETRRMMNSEPAQSLTMMSGWTPKLDVRAEDQERMMRENVRQRRSLLDQQPAMGPPVQIEIVPSRNLPLTPAPERQITPASTGDEKP
jgi:hypothetical protein